MRACTHCGLDCPDDAALCYACAFSLARSPDLSPMTNLGQPGTLPYGWGRFQGALLIIGGLGQFSTKTNPSGLESDSYTIMLNIFLGFCIQRRNRLILPLMVIAIVLLILDIALGFMRKDQAAPVLAVGLCIWALYAYYYYKRRFEFKRWI